MMPDPLQSEALTASWLNLGSILAAAKNQQVSSGIRGRKKMPGHEGRKTKAAQLRKLIWSQSR